MENKNNNSVSNASPAVQGGEEVLIWKLLQEVKDPEIPVLSILELGMVRRIELSNALPSDESTIIITITPTYSGCPAMDTINMDIRLKLIEHGYKKITVVQSLSPAWTTDWMSEEGKHKLKQFGIAPPNPKQQFCTIKNFFEEEAVQCPLCHSYHTKLISQFGSTACKALYQCSNCLEAFDYFKCH